MPVPSRPTSNPLFEMFYKPPLTWADHVTNYIDGLSPQVDVVDDSTDSSSDEYSPSDSLFVELDIVVEDTSVAPGAQQSTREEFAERFHFTQKYWPIEEVSTEGDSDSAAPPVPESSGPVAGEDPRRFERSFHAEDSRQSKTPPQVVDSQATQQDTKFVSSPYITNPPSQKKTSSKGSRRAGTHRRHRKKVPKKAKAKEKQKDQPAEAASTFAGAATLNNIVDPMTIAAPVACRSSAEAATLMNIIDPANIATRASSPIDSSEPVIIVTPINLPPSPFPSWRSSPSPPWEKVVRRHKYTFKERIEYREKQATASGRPITAPSSATHSEEMSTMPSPILPSVEINTTPSPILLSMEVASVCSEVSTEVMEATSTTDTHRDTSEESVERTPVAPAPILLFSKEDTESSIVPEAASMTENHPDTRPESVEGALVLPAPAVSVTKEEPESAVVDTKAPSKTETRYALAPAVLTSTPNIDSSIVDTVTTPETKSLDTFAPTVPTLTPEYNPPFIVDSKEYYKKLRERQPDMDKVQAFEEGMRYAQELRENEERRAAAEGNQRQGHYAQQNQTTYYHPNGIPMIASAAAFPWYQPEGSNTLASVPYPYLVQHTPQGMYPLTWQRMNSHYWSFDEACAHQDNPYQCMFDPSCCQHRHPYAHQSGHPLPAHESCCCYHGRARCCPCFTLEQQNEPAPPGGHHTEIPRARWGHDFSHPDYVRSIIEGDAVEEEYHADQTSYAAPFGPAGALIEGGARGFIQPASRFVQSGSAQYSPAGALIQGGAGGFIQPASCFVQSGSVQYGPTGGAHPSDMGGYNQGGSGGYAPTGQAAHVHHNHHGDMGGYNQGSGPQRRSRVSGNQHWHRSSGSHRHSTSSDSYRHNRAGSGPGPSVATTPSRPVLRGTLDSWGNPPIQPNLHIPQEPVPVPGLPVVYAATEEIARADEERARQYSRPVPVRRNPKTCPMPATTSPGSTAQENLTAVVSLPQNSSTPASPPQNLTPPTQSLSQIPSPIPIESTNPPVVNMDSRGPSPKESLVPSVVSLFEQARKMESCETPRSSPRQPPPIPLLRERPATQPKPEQHKPEQHKPEQHKPEHLALQSLRVNDPAINTPDTPREFFDAKQEQNPSPVPSEKSDRPTTPDLTVGPATGPTTPAGSPKKSCVKSPEPKDISPPRSVGFGEDSRCSPPDGTPSEKVEVSSMYQGMEDTNVHLILTPVTNLSAKAIIHKAHRAVLSHSSPFLAEALRAQNASDNKITRINIHTGARFSAMTSFGLALQVLYGWLLVSSQNLRSETLKGLGYDPEKSDSALPFSIRLAKTDFALCYAAVGAFLGCSNIVKCGIQLALDLLDWETVDFLLCFVLHVDEYMLTCPEIRVASPDVPPDTSQAGKVGDEYLADFHLVQANLVMKAVFKYMTENVRPEFELYERAQASYIKTRIPPPIWTLPGSLTSNIRLESIRYGNQPSYADLKPKRMDINVLSAMLITLPFHMFMPLIDELKKAPLMTRALMKKVVEKREERRLHALYIRVQRKIKPGVIPQAYLDELAYREFITPERPGDGNVVTATIQRVWVGLDFPNQAARTPRPVTAADTQDSSDPAPNAEASNAPGASAEAPTANAKKNKNRKKNRKKH